MILTFQLDCIAHNNRPCPACTVGLFYKRISHGIKPAPFFTNSMCWQINIPKEKLDFFRQLCAEAGVKPKEI